MSVLEKFKIYGVNASRSFVSITANGLTFSAEAVRLLGSPAFVRLLLNMDNRQFAIQPCESWESGALHLVKKDRTNARTQVRWNDKTVITPILKMLPADRDPDGVRVNGIYYEEENCIIFDCRIIDKLSRGGRKNNSA